MQILERSELLYDLQRAENPRHSATHVTFIALVLSENFNFA